MKIFDKIIKIDDLKNIPINSPIGIIYNSSFGVLPKDILNYVESLGGITNFIIEQNTPYKDKLTIIKNYIQFGNRIYSNQLLNTTLILYLSYKNVKEEILESNLLTFTEIISATNDLQNLLKNLSKQISSIFVIMLLCAKYKTNDISSLKQYYPPEMITNEEFCGCLIPMLKSKEFIDIYKYGIEHHPYFYTNLFIDEQDNVKKWIFRNDNYLIKGLDILINDPSFLKKK